MRARVVDQYRQPFDAILSSPTAQAELENFDRELALCQLVGPLAFARMTGIRAITHDDCANLVDDFLAAHCKSDDGETKRVKAASLHAGRPLA